MDKKKAKYIASIIELIILFIIASYLITKSIGKYFIEDVKLDYRSKRQNPNYAFLGGLFGKSPFEILNGIVGQKVTLLFKKFLSFLTPIFKIFTKIFKLFQHSINKVRNLLRPIRDFFKKAAEKFYSSISKYVIGTVYSLNKIRNSMRRTMSGFNLIFHTLEHSKNSLQSIIQSPPVKISMALVEPIDWVVSSANKLFCFDGYTPIFDINTNMMFLCDVKVGDILEDGSQVIAKHKFKHEHRLNPLYNYKNNILVTGEHKVYENNKWIYVKDSSNATISFSKPDYVYCITTSSNIINIYGNKFKDYSESNNKYINYTVNSLLLTYFNGNTIDSLEYASEVDYLEHGFSGETLVKTDKGLVKIKDVRVGDKLVNNDLVIGYVKILNSKLEFYKNSENLVLSSNMKIYENSIWKNIEKSLNFNKFDFFQDAYNLVTTSGFIYLENGDKYLDYLESSDTILNRAIDRVTEII